jgi:hypothetical protein
MKIIRAIKFEHQITIDGGRVSWRIFGRNAGRNELDHRIGVGGVEVGDRIAVCFRLVEDPMRRRQKTIVRPIRPIFRVY